MLAANREPELCSRTALLDRGFWGLQALKTFQCFEGVEDTGATGWSLPNTLNN